MSLSLTVFAVLRLVTDRRTDRRNWSIKRRHYALKCTGRQKPWDTCVSIAKKCQRQLGFLVPQKDLCNMHAYSAHGEHSAVRTWVVSTSSSQTCLIIAVWRLKLLLTVAAVTANYISVLYVDNILTKNKSTSYRKQIVRTLISVNLGRTDSGLAGF